MSDEVSCEFCDKTFKNKHTLNMHQKNTARCIKIQVEKLGKPLHENKNKKVEEVKKEVKSESEISESEHEEKRISEMSSESEDDNIRWSDDDIKESESDEEEIILPIKKEVVKRSFKKESPKKERSREKVHSPLLEAKIDTILTIFSKLEKDLDTKFKNVNSQITKLHSLLEECNPLVIIETIKKLQAMIEVKQENVEFIKEQFEELFDNFYSVYKKIKYVKEDLEDMIHK